MPYKIVRRDITKVRVDAMVNIINSDHVYTSKMVLAKHILSIAEPPWEGGDKGEYEALAACYETVLERAVKMDYKSIIFPLIAAETKGYSKGLALQTAINSISLFLQNHDMNILLTIRDAGEIDLVGDKFAGLEKYVKEKYTRPAYKKKTATLCGGTGESEGPFRGGSDNDLKHEKIFMYMGMSLGDKLLGLIDKKGMDEVDVYKKANVSRQVFSNIRNKEEYTPKKGTVMALAIALELDFDEAKDLLETAGYAFSNASKTDVVVKSFYEKGTKFSVDDVNAALVKYHLRCLTGDT